ncbi:MAG TPA: signal peptidase I [Thermoanaerobaculia bacterium]|nr:signal peptidase I [Thermoanaerobaculia bacterium]
MNKKKVLEELRVFLIMILVISSLRSALADWNDVPTGSMKPTIQEGDRVVVNKLAYDLKIPFTTVGVFKWADPSRGDIVVLFSPADGTRLVKRVIAVPGDRVEMIENHLFVNGRVAPVSGLTGPLPDEQQGMAFVADESLAGRSHKVMFTPQVPAVRSFPAIVVPARKYFVMGDNRDNSNDSRFIGFVDRRQIVGKATAVAFSLDRDRYYAPRFHRFFTRLH